MSIYYMSEDLCVRVFEIRVMHIESCAQKAITGTRAYSASS